MALLQAARARKLGLPLESAYSWGLTKATFIAAAKRGFKGGSGSAKGVSDSGQGQNQENTYFLGDDMAFKTEVNGVLLFTFGGKVQTKEEFDKRVRARFAKSYQAAWREAQAYVNRFDKDVLLSSESFYQDVYRPARDEWAERWTLESEK